MGAACVRPIQHDGNQSKPYVGNYNSYHVQLPRNQRTPSSSSRSGNQNSSTQDGRFVGRLSLEGERTHNVKIVPLQEQQLKQQQIQQQQQQQRELQQQQREQQEQLQLQQQQQQQQREHQEQLQLQQQQQKLEQERQLQQEQLQLQQQREQQEQLQLRQQLEQEQQLQQEQQQLQQNQPRQQQSQPVTDAGSLNQTYELSHNLNSTTDGVPTTDCHNETQVDSPKELKRCDSLIDDDNYCPTCFYGYELGNPKIPTKCHHHYHLACIIEWMERSNKCPVCDQEMIILQM